MRLERLLSALAALACALVSVPATACAASTPECTCPDRAIYVRVPDERANSVIDVTPSGVACAGVKASCLERGPSRGCTKYRVGPTNAGACHIDVDFSTQGPRFSADARVVASGGCCGGFVTDPPSASDIDVPAAAASAADAGGAG